MQGRPCIFVRFAGCNLACPYCDTKYARKNSSGARISRADILRRISRYPCRYVCLTGGEPLLQENIHPLIKALLKKKYMVSVETNGSRDISKLPAGAHIVMDIKCPGSTHACDNMFENLKALKPLDEIKFVIKDRNDYDWAKMILKAEKITGHRPGVIFSPVYGRLDPGKLAGWVLKDRLPVRVQVQLHKLLGIK